MYIFGMILTMMFLAVSGWWMAITLFLGLKAELARQMTEAKNQDNFLIIGGTVLSPFVAALAYMILRTIH